MRISSFIYVTSNTFFFEISDMGCMSDDMVGYEIGCEKVICLFFKKKNILLFDLSILKCNICFLIFWNSALFLTRNGVQNEKQVWKILEILKINLIFYANILDHMDKVEYMSYKFA